MNSFAKFLPSKSFLAVGTAVFFSVFLIFGMYKLTHSEVTANKPIIPVISTENAAAVASIQAAISEKDTDLDTLKDWEESFWGTDPNNKDSDGDGTTDGEEVKNGRNPIKKGPDDKIVISSQTTAENSGVETTLTATDIVARSVFSNYLQAKESGNDVSGNLQKEIVSAALTLKNAGNTEIQRLYTEADLNIVKGNDKNTLKKYGEEMGTIIKSATWKERELDIIKKALEKGDETILLQLNPIISGYQSIIDASIKIDVPEGAKKEHLAVLNAMKQLVYSLKSVQTVFEDPVKTLSVFGKYPDQVNSLYRAFVDVSGFFKRNDISYTSTENGAYYAYFAEATKYKASQAKK